MFAASKSGRAGSAAPTTDASFAYVPLLTETGSVSVAATTVADGAQTPNTVTRNNSVSTGWTSPYQTDGYWSNQFNGTNAYLTSTIPALTGQFTIDFWVYRPASGNNWFFTIGDTVNSTGLEVYIGSSGTTLNVYSNGASQITSSTLPTVGSWNYIAVTRDASSQIKLYLNGTQLGITWGSAVTFATTLRLGVEFYNSTFQYGNNYISNFRISNTVRTVSSNPTAPFTSDANTLFLSCQSNRFIDNSTANSGVGFPITVNGTPSVQSGYYPFAAPTASPGAALFNGTNQYLNSTTATTAFQFGTSPYTVECWLYQPSRPARQYICGGLFSGIGFQIFMDSPGLIRCSATNIGDLPVATIAVPLNAWTHIAVVRTSTSAGGVVYYINGAPAGTNTMSADISGTASSINVGTSANNITSQSTNGYIANFRAVKGIAVYTGAFTPPSGPLTQTGGTYPSTTNVNTSIPAANTSLLLNLADSNYTSASSGGTNNTFIDDSTNAFTITRNGTPTQGSRTPYWPNGQWSNYFNGSTDYLTTPANAAFTFGTGDLTLECWIYQTATSTSAYKVIFTDNVYAAAGGYALYSYNNALNLWRGGAEIIAPAGTINLNAWTHVAWTRSGSFNRLFINGTQVGATTTNANSYTGTITYIGASSVPTLFFPGYISNARIVKGTAVYTTNFTPSTTPLTATQSANINGNPSAAITGTATSLLTCQSNRFIDNSSNNFTVTPSGTPSVQAFQPFAPAASYSAATYAGSGYFPPSSSSYLSSTITALSNTFVVMECWLYNNSLDNSQGNHYLQMGTGTYALSHNGNGAARFLSRNDSAGDIFDIISANGVLKLNQWQYVVGIRNATTASLYVDGARVGTLTVSTSSTSSTAFYASSNAGSGRYLDGYMANARIISGSLPSGYDPASTTISIPTTPLTNVAGTRVLLNMANAGIYDAAAQNVITTVGDAQVSTTITPKWPPSSMKFDGTGDYLTMPLTPATTITSGNFTIEFWLNPSTVATATQAIIGTSEGVGSGTINWLVYLVTSALSFQCYSNASVLMVNFSHQTTLSAGTWYYCALTRSGSTFTLYINGVASTSTPTSAATISQSGTTLYVGKFGASSTINALSGYIQDLRMTKGVARTITTPTAAFPTR